MDVSKLKDEGNFDRGLRALVGIVLISPVFIGPETLWGLLGLMPLLTAFTGFCPGYRLSGVDTCPKKQLEE